MANPTLTHLEYCSYCPKMCRHACPVSTASGREALIPQARMAGLAQLLKGNEPWTRETTEPLWGGGGGGPRGPPPPPPRPPPRRVPPPRGAPGPPRPGDPAARALRRGGPR